MKYKGIVREVYKYEIEVEADNTDEAIRKLKENYAGFCSSSCNS